MDELLVERVLRAVECVPPGQVVSYGMVAELVGTSPRLVGRIMAAWGSNVAWWRVTNASGRLPEAITIRALEQWTAEGTPLTADRHGAAIAHARTDANQLAAAWQAACADLPAQ